MKGAWIFALGLLAAVPVDAADFSVQTADKILTISGTLTDGDDARFSAYAARQIPKGEQADGDWRVALAGTDGPSPPALALGRQLRRLGLPSLVRAGAPCAGACALAFLGGTRRYTTGIGFGRMLEPGAELTFGAPTGLDAAQTRDLLAYLAEMRGIERGLVADALLAPAPVAIRSPGQMLALSITLTTPPKTLPKGQAASPQHACRWGVETLLPPLDPALIDKDPTARLAATAITLRQGALIRHLAATIRASDRLGPSVKTIPNTPIGDKRIFARHAADLFDLDPDQPPALAYAVDLNRGGGFYADRCYAIPDQAGEYRLLILDLPRMAVRTLHPPPLAAFDPDQPLWPTAPVRPRPLSRGPSRPLHRTGTLLRCRRLPARPPGR